MENYGFTVNMDGNATIKAAELANLLGKLGDKGDEAGKKIHQTNSGLMSSFGGLKNLVLGFATGYGLKSLASYVIQVGVETEQTRASFDVMLGSAEKGKAMFESLKTFADITPFDNKTAYDAGRLLLNYGIAANQIIPSLKMLGDASGGVTERFDRMVYAYGQIMTAGKLQGQDLRQLIDAGFNPLQEISAKTGKSMTELKKQMESGGISAQMVTDAFKSATSEGGRFFGMMETQSQTVGGLWSTLMGGMQTAAYGLFQQASPLLKGLIQNAIDISDSLKDAFTPLESDLLTENMMQMNAMFAALKDGNIAYDQKAKLISQINAITKDYNVTSLTEKATEGEKLAIQQQANQALLDKIKLKGQEEALEKYYKELAKANKEVTEYQIEKQRQLISNKGDTKEFGYTWHLEAYSKAMVRKEKAEKELNQALSASGISGISSNSLTLQQQEAKLRLQAKSEQWTSGMLANKIEELQSGGGVTGMKAVPTISETMKADAMKTTAAAHGGTFGEAKIINLNFNQPLMAINAQNIEGKDMERNANYVISLIARELNNINFGSGLQ